VEIQAMWFTPSNSIADSSRDPDPPYCPARDPGRCPGDPVASG
jgi:hypothetical protein